jgi:hypothetical protein
MAWQPHPMTSVMQLTVTAAALCVAGAAVIFTVRSMTEERNARLVEIGISVLRVDQAKNPQVEGAREWALDLIDANAGGVKFSPTARQALILGQFYSEPINDFAPYGSANIYPDKKPPHSN